jgi:predicted nucleic acid-binding protein
VIFVDSNVPMYLIGDDCRLKRDAQRVLERLVAERSRFVTSSEVFQELLHRYGAGGGGGRVEAAFETLRALVEDVHAVEEADVFAAKDLLHAHPRLSARDALHVAVMRRHEIAQIVSFDRGFDAVGGIARLPASGS